MNELLKMLHSTISQRKGRDNLPATTWKTSCFCQALGVDPIFDKRASECQTVRVTEISGRGNSTPDKFSRYILLVNAALVLRSLKFLICVLWIAFKVVSLRRWMIKCMHRSSHFRRCMMILYVTYTTFHFF
jgi:hypothetical protein